METKQKITKKFLKEFIMDTANSDEFFLMETLGGLDLLMNAILKSVDKMNKKTLLQYYNVAKDRREGIKNQSQANAEHYIN